MLLSNRFYGIIFEGRVPSTVETATIVMGRSKKNIASSFNTICPRLEMVRVASSGYFLKFKISVLY